MLFFRNKWKKRIFMSSLFRYQYWKSVKQECMSFDTVMWNQNIEKAKLCCMDTDRFIVHIKTEAIYVYDVETRFDTYELERPLPTRLYNKVIVLMKDELGGKIMMEFAALRSKTAIEYILVIKI